MREFAERWRPILDACGEAGIRYALEIHPGQIAFDLYSAEMTLETLEGRDEFGFTFDPSHLFWQGVDPVEFLKRFPDRIYNVHIKDVAMTLNGRTGVLNAYQPYGDPRRGWQSRSPGHGGMDWESIFRGLNEIRYEGRSPSNGRTPAWNASSAPRKRAFVSALDFPARSSNESYNHH